MKILQAFGCLLLLAAPLSAQTVDTLAGRKIVFLGDSITQDGRYVAFASYYLQRLYPRKDFDFYPLGLGSETVSGLSEPNHAGGAFPRPCLFARLGRLLERVKPGVVFACYGMNDGVYLPLDADRFAAFRKGINDLVRQCQAAGVQDVFLVTPPIYDVPPDTKPFNYDAVLAEYAAWETTLNLPGVHIIDLHSAMSKARAARTEPFSGDHVHPGAEGHLLMAATILAALGVHPPAETPAKLEADPLFKLVDDHRKLRWDRWMNHIGYTRERTVAPQPLGTAEPEAAALQAKINALRREPLP